MKSRDSDGSASRTRAQRTGARTTVVTAVVAIGLVLGGVTPVAGGAAGAAQIHDESRSAADQWTTPPTPRAQAQANDTVPQDKREAAEAGVDEAVATLQRQGVSVNQSQRAAAVDGAVAAVAQHQNASVEQIQNASYGATTGTLLQSQNVSVRQVQNATYGSASGALSQHRNASATQLQHAAFGASHGAVAQQQNASVEQVQVVAQGAAAGAAHEAGNRTTAGERVHPGAIREAAQGAAFGAIGQEQNATVEQRQHAAAGAAEGALSQNQSASVKQIQVAAMGAAEGALSVSQAQNVTVEQVQAAARGACKGALTQVQNVSVTQIQKASFGAAKGAISQSQTASVTQIQAAATGGAEGVLVQRQTVSVTQIQYAATGAAAGAAKSAAQNQIVNVRQIQAAAAGAGRGTVVQIQQIDIVQIQIIAESGASGALSQYQEASVVQIQSAARGACEGAVSLTQRQDVTVEQVQIVTRRAASDAAATAARINVDNDVTIINYARGAAEDPDEDGEDAQLASLFASATDETVFLANPNDVAVTVTLTSQDGDVQTQTLAAGESVTLEPAQGTYTLTAETGDGRDVEIAGRDELTVSVGPAVQTLNATVDGQVLAVENPNDERVTVDVLRNGSRVDSFDVPADWNVTVRLEAGTYALTAETAGGESVPVNGEDEARVVVEPALIDLNASVEAGNLTVENPSNTTVEATVTGEAGEERTFDVPPGEAVTEQFEPGNYTLTADAEDREVQVEGQATYQFTVERPESIDLSVAIDGRNVSFENPSDTDVQVTAANDTGENRTIEVPGGENVTETVAPGNYTLTGESDTDRAVLLDNESELTITVAGEAEPPEATLDVADQTGNGTELIVADATASVPFVVTAAYDDANVTSEEFDANASVENRSLELDPPIENDTDVTVTVRSVANGTALANETVQFTVAEPNETATPPETPPNETVNETVAPNETETPTDTPNETETPTDTPNETETPANETTVPPEPPGENETEGATEPINETETAVATDAGAPTEAETATETVETAETTETTEATEQTEAREATETARTTPTPTAPAQTPTGTATPNETDGLLTPGVEYENCTTARVNGTYDRLNVTLGYYDESGNVTDYEVLTPIDVPWERPVDGQTIVTIGETEETNLTDDGRQIIQFEDPGTFGDDVGSFVANVSASASPDDDPNVSAVNPERPLCRQNGRPEAPTLSIESIEAQDNETAVVNLSYENPNDAALNPSESLFSNGTVESDPPATLEPGVHSFTVEWTPQSPDETLAWTVNLSNFGLGNVTAESRTAGSVSGLLEPPNETATATPSPTPTETPTPTPTETETLTPTETETPTETSTESPTETPTPADTPTDTPTATATPSPTATATESPTNSPTPEPTDTPTPEPTDTSTPEPTDAPADEGAETPTETEARIGSGTA